MYSDPGIELKNEFVESIKKFIEYRDKHGGILLPNSFYVERVFHNAMIDAGLYQKSPEKSSEPYILGQSKNQ